MFASLMLFFLQTFNPVSWLIVFEFQSKNPVISPYTPWRRWFFLNLNSWLWSAEDDEKLMRRWFFCHRPFLLRWLATNFLTLTNECSNSIERNMDCFIVHVRKTDPEPTRLRALKRRTQWDVELYVIDNHPPQHHLTFKCLFFEKVTQIHPEK